MTAGNWLMKLFELLLGDAPLCLICKDASSRCMYCGGGTRDRQGLGEGAAQIVRNYSGEGSENMSGKKSMNVGIIHYPDGNRMIVVSESSLAVDDFLGKEINKYGLGQLRTESIYGCPVIALSEEDAEHYATIREHLT